MVLSALAVKAARRASGIRYGFWCPIVLNGEHQAKALIDIVLDGLSPIRKALSLLLAVNWRSYIPQPPK